MNSNDLLLTARGTVLARNMSDHTGYNSRSPGLLRDISRSIFSSGVLLARCRKGGHFSQVVFLVFFFLSPPGVLQISAAWSPLAPSTP